MSTKRSALAALLATVFSLANPAPARAADRVERTDGRVLEGRIVEETKDAVVIESRSGDLMYRQKVSRKNIKSLQRETREGPGYCVILIEGTIGGDVTAAAMRRALTDAKQSGASIIILSINSSGGLVETRDQIIALFKEFKDFKYVAHVKEAMSSAAVLALACRRIYFMERGKMGAAVAYRVMPDGTFAPLEAKVRSAVQAGERAAAAMGGHSDLWIRGMTEPELELAVFRDAKGEPRIVEAGTHWEGETLIKRRGQILTLTGLEARDLGLSSGTAKTLDDIRQAMGIEKWHNASDGPASIMVGQARAARSRARDVEDGRKELARIDAAADAAMKRRTAASQEFEKIKAMMEQEGAPIIAEYQMRLAKAQKAKYTPQQIASIEAQGNRRLDPIRAKYDEPLRAAQRVAEDAARELEQLKSRRADLVASLRD